MIYDNVLPTLLIIIEIDQWFNLTSRYLLPWDVNRVYKIEYNPQHLITENAARWSQMQIIKASRRIGTAQDVNWINTSLQSKTWINCVVIILDKLYTFYKYQLWFYNILPSLTDQSQFNTPGPVSVAPESGLIDVPQQFIGIVNATSQLLKASSWPSRPSRFDHGSWLMSPLNITQPLGIWSIMATIRWCPIYPKWDSYQPLLMDDVKLGIFKLCSSIILCVKRTILEWRTHGIW